MSDATWRAAERRYAANPGDPAALQRLIAARRRAGLSVGHLLEAEVFPAREVASKLALRVSIEALNGKELEVGETKGGASVSVPAHRRLLVRPAPTKVTSALVSELRERGLPGLSLERSRIGDQELAALQDLPGLRWLSLRSCGGVTDAGFGRLATALPQLEYLDLSGCRQLGGAGVSRLASLKNLTELRLENHEWKDSDLESLGALTQLRRLSLRGAKDLKGDGLAHLAPLSGLVDLDLSNCRKLSGKRFLSLPALPELRGLDLQWSWNLTDPALPALERQERLERLSLGTTRFTPQGLFGSERLRQLRELRLFEVDEYRSTSLDPKQYRKFTDEVFDWIVSLPALEVLRLEQLSPWITDAGLARLAEVPRLRELWVFDCTRLTGAGVRALFERRPELVIRFASGRAGDDARVELGVEPSGKPEAGPSGESLAPHILEVLSLKRLHAIAELEGVRPANRRTKSAGREALGEVPLERLLERMEREELAKACRRLKLTPDEYESKDKLVQRILGAFEGAERSPGARG